MSAGFTKQGNFSARLHEVLTREINLGDMKITESRNPTACVKKKENDQRIKLSRVEDL